MSHTLSLPKNPLICAVDTPDVAKAAALSAALASSVGAIKLGLEFFTSNGPEAVRTIAKAGTPIFLDLKLHDIPNTVAGATRAATQLNIAMLTIHTAGGLAMMQAAKEAAAETAASLGKASPLLLGITVLTSLSYDDLGTIGVAAPAVKDQVIRLALLAKKAGLGGVVCSPHEIAVLRQECGDDFVLVTPGIRPKGSALADQKRVMTPEEAIKEGADFIVVGRPITEAPDPKEAAKQIVSLCAA